MPKIRRTLYTMSPLAVAIGALLPLSGAWAADFPSGTYAAGSHVSIVFTNDGQFRVVQDKATQVSGTYTVKGDQIELTDNDGPWACTKEGEHTGTYTWKYGKPVLSLSKVSDPCQDRVGSLTRTVWKQAK